LGRHASPSSLLRVTHLKLLAGEFAVYEKHFLFSGDLFCQLGGKEGLPGIGTRKEDSVLTLDNEGRGNTSWA